MVVDYPMEIIKNYLQIGKKEIYFRNIEESDFINSSVSSLVKKLMDHNINTILLPAKEYKNMECFFK